MITQAQKVQWYRLRQRWPDVEDVYWQIQGRTFAGKRCNLERG